MEGEGIANVTPAAAAAVVNYDMFDTEIMLATATYDREIYMIGCAGGNAVNEAQIDLFIGTDYHGTVRNTTAGAVIAQPDDDIIPVSIIVPKNEKITPRVVAAPTVSPLNLIMGIRKK